MTIKELNNINGESAFKESRVQQLKSILVMLTIAGYLVVLILQMFDKYYFTQTDNRLFWLRVITLAAYSVNLIVAFFRNTDHAYKQHLTAGFYLGTTFYMLLAVFTGASQSPYWFGLFFIIIGWFVLVPYNYRELILHSLAFFILFMAGFFVQSEFEILQYEIAKMGLLYSASLLIGFYAAFSRNQRDAESYLLTRALKEKNKDLNKFMKVLEQAPGSVIIMDTQMNFEYLNPMFTQLSGYTEDELLHKNINDTIYQGKAPESRAEVIQALFKGEKWQGELLTYHKSKEPYWANTIASPYKDEQGNVEGYIIIQQDISEHKKMELALQENETLYRTLIEKSLDGVSITRNRRFFLVNQAFCNILGYSEKEIMEIQPESILAPEERERLLEIHDKRMRGELDTLNYVAKFLHKSGARLTIEMNSTTVQVAGQNASFVTIRDITERLKTEHELQTAKQNLEMLNRDLEQRVIESSENLTEARTLLINLQKENLQSQFDVLKQQVNPHFLFNSLNVLTSLIKLEPDLAEKFSEHLSKVYRYVLENKDNELVDLNTELLFLDAYIFLLNIRFVNKLRVNINIPESMRSYQVIPLAMQLLIENAIKHNTMSKSSPLQIDIYIDKMNFLNIVNNLQERPSQIVSTGIGLKNIQNRYLLLNNTEPVFEKTDTHFIARVPLVINH